MRRNKTKQKRGEKTNQPQKERFESNHFDDDYDDDQSHHRSP